MVACLLPMALQLTMCISPARLGFGLLAKRGMAPVRATPMVAHSIPGFSSASTAGTCPFRDPENEKASLSFGKSGFLPHKACGRRQAGFPEDVDINDNKRQQRYNDNNRR